MSKFSTFIVGRLRGCGYAIKGALILLKTEPSIQVQAVIAIVMTALGFYNNITGIEWILQTFAIGLVMSVEGVNTAIEAIADFIHPDFHNKIGFIKDIAAGAVFIAAITAVIIGCIIYYPYLF
ncbi:MULTISPECIES: diacylglycerol kinase [unclassified Aquimarina]|uniref:diacylglycerol kinase n=1 Tax=unclassified Aquimarina TaxID=2627091 RepID=UPI000D54B8BD|nr:MULTISPECIES: diacylglycerol kinase family protein [unclassified Aquimarina]AXT55644.1 diacylglycerol kinase family protein [Aquimarina sp. AD1]RKN24976.1 diacylglycerol kinase family protein [Aquimarina sp. AD1]